MVGVDLVWFSLACAVVDGVECLGGCVVPAGVCAWLFVVLCCEIVVEWDALAVDDEFDSADEACFERLVVGEVYEGDGEDLVVVDTAADTNAHGAERLHEVRGLFDGAEHCGGFGWIDDVDCEWEVDVDCVCLCVCVLEDLTAVS